MTDKYVRDFSSRPRVRMPKRMSRDPSFHFLVLRVNHTTECAFVRISSRYDDASTVASYQSIVDKIHVDGIHSLSIGMIITINKNSKSQAFLKYLSFCPEHTQVNPEIEDQVQKCLCSEGVID